MAEKADYIKWIRSKVGHDKIFLNFCIAFIRNAEGQVLFQRRGDSNLWGIIGGCIELGENFETCLRREIFEETALENFEIKHLLGVYTGSEFTYPNGDTAQPIEHYYVVDTHDKVNLDYRDEETLELRWVDIANLDLPLFNENQRQAFADYIAWSNKEK